MASPSPCSTSSTSCSKCLLSATTVRWKSIFYLKTSRFRITVHWIVSDSRLLWITGFRRRRRRQSRKVIWEIWINVLIVMTLHQLFVRGLSYRRLNKLTHCKNIVYLVTGQSEQSHYPTDNSIIIQEFNLSPYTIRQLYTHQLVQWYMIRDLETDSLTPTPNKAISEGALNVSNKLNRRIALCWTERSEFCDSQPTELGFYSSFVRCLFSMQGRGCNTVPRCLGHVSHRLRRYRIRSRVSGFQDQLLRTSYFRVYK